MPSSYLVCTENYLIKEINVKKFHLNLWQINADYIRTEVGLLLNISKEEFLNHEIIKFNLFTAFPVQENSLSIVYENLLKFSNISLIFNEKCQEIKDHTTSSNSSYASSITLGNKDNFILINAEISFEECEKRKIVFTITPKNIDLNALNETIDLYVRFYYKIDLKKCDNFIKKYKPSNDFIIYDIRL
jgi:hypothetical protein